jgi:hypothetical protein
VFATSFAAEPAPTGPTYTGVPSVERSGVHRSKSGADPPTKILSAPDSVSPMLPSTGVSSRPVSEGSAAASLVVSGTLPL